MEDINIKDLTVSSGNLNDIFKLMQSSGQFKHECIGLAITQKINKLTYSLNQQKFDFEPTIIDSVEFFSSSYATMIKANYKRSYKILLMVNKFKIDQLLELRNQHGKNAIIFVVDSDNATMKLLANSLIFTNVSLITIYLEKNTRKQPASRRSAAHFESVDFLTDKQVVWKLERDKESNKDYFKYYFFESELQMKYFKVCHKEYSFNTPKTQKFFNNFEIAEISKLSEYIYSLDNLLFVDKLTKFVTIEETVHKSVNLISSFNIKFYIMDCNIYDLLKHLGKLKLKKTYIFLANTDRVLVTHLKSYNFEIITKN